jgi:hypothetical protein
LSPPLALRLIGRLLTARNPLCGQAFIWREI